MARNMNILDMVENIMFCPFVWGKTDCCTSACDVFNALHGIDPMQIERGYSDVIGAIRVVQKWGDFPNMIDSLARIANLKPSVGLPGEIGYIISDGPIGYALAICVESGAWAIKTQHGFAVVQNAERAWRA